MLKEIISQTVLDGGMIINKFLKKMMISQDKPSSQMAVCVKAKNAIFI